VDKKDSLLSNDGGGHGLESIEKRENYLNENKTTTITTAHDRNTSRESLEEKSKDDSFQMGSTENETEKDVTKLSDNNNNNNKSHSKLDPPPITSVSALSSSLSSTGYIEPIGAAWKYSRHEGGYFESIKSHLNSIKEFMPSDTNTTSTPPSTSSTQLSETTPPSLNLWTHETQKEMQKQSQSSHPTETITSAPLLNLNPAAAVAGIDSLPSTGTASSDNANDPLNTMTALSIAATAATAAQTSCASSLKSDTQLESRLIKYLDDERAGLKAQLEVMEESMKVSEALYAETLAKWSESVAIEKRMRAELDLAFQVCFIFYIYICFFTEKF
jgi:hypothetical protein